MIIKPIVRNNVCINSHPAGCAAVVMRQIEYARTIIAGRNDPKESGRCEGTPRLALLAGRSAGYGLASRIAAFRHDFPEAHGFDVAGIDYEADVDPSGIL